MLYQKYIVFILVNCIKYCILVSTKNQNDAAKILKYSSNFTIQGRQNFKQNPYYDLDVIPQNKYNYPYPNQYLKYPKYAKPFAYKPIPDNPYLRPNLYYSDPYYQQSAGKDFRQRIMDILYSIASNDDLHCVPKILCEITSGTIDGRQNGLNLPININMDSILGLLSSLNGLQSSPLLYFGKAALLGYSSKGSARSCIYAYPECPSDPEKLVQYLNNHNGGFFRYFNGINAQNYAPQYQNFHPPHYRQQGDIGRIQNGPVTYISTNNIGQRGIQFPEGNQYHHRPDLTFDSIFSLKPTNAFKFPDVMNEEYKNDAFRKPKKLDSDVYFYNQNGIHFEKPLPDHKALPIIFPDRTGTGELIIDSEEFDKNNFGFESNKPEYTTDNVRNYYNLNEFKNGKRLFFPDR